MTHAKDAMWQADPYVELLAAVAMAATHLSQLGQDFEIYASQEFGLVELADRHSRASALMPQKRNPYALAAVRTQAGQAAGDLAAALTTLHTGSARTDHFHLLNGLVRAASRRQSRHAELAAAVVEGCGIAGVASSASRATASVDGRRADVLANAHARSTPHAPTRSSARAVRDLVAAGGTPLDLTPALATAAERSPAMRCARRRVLADALDPGRLRRERLQVGSSPRHADLLAECDAELEAGPRLGVERGSVAERRRGARETAAAGGAVDRRGLGRAAAQAGGRTRHSVTRHASRSPARWRLRALGPSNSASEDTSSQPAARASAMRRRTRAAWRPRPRAQGKVEALAR
jgi:argininosuccinate lyase